MVKSYFCRRKQITVMVSSVKVSRVGLVGSVEFGLGLGLGVGLDLG